MVEALRFFIEQTHRIHSAILNLNDIYGWSLSDKDLHFIVFGAFSVGLFVMVHALFTRLIKLSLTSLSFVYVFTVMFALAMAIEFGQRITQQGIMDFEDVTYGMFGVFVFLVIYLLLRFIYQSLQRFINQKKRG